MSTDYDMNVSVRFRLWFFLTVLNTFVYEAELPNCYHRVNFAHSMDFSHTGATNFAF